MGLDPSKHLGKELSSLEFYLHKLKELYGINVCGEGGEYETLTLDCPLFKNARIVLDDFQVVLHSSDPICPVGILHPVAFHVEQKLDNVSSVESNKSNGNSLEESDLVTEVLGDCPSMQVTSPTTDFTATLAKVDDLKLHVSRTKQEEIFTISCWLQDTCKTSADLQADLVLVLTKIELELAECHYSWENVLYIHLYIADMNKFAIANETYVRFITQDKCRFGVPSRSTIELPLLQAGLGMGYIEVLVADDDTKKVLHVQSISSWAPSCIGPYSQATLHKNVLYMAGQLGLDPPTMLLASGGPTSELEQALDNSEAVARCFNCSLSTSTILFIIYCSNFINETDRSAIERKANTFLKERKSKNLDDERLFDVVDPMFLYVLVPDLPKRAFVEVKPMLYAGGKKRATLADAAVVSSSRALSYGGFQHESWISECLQKYVIPGELCATILSVKGSHVAKICSTLESVDNDADNKALNNEQLEIIAKFCFYLLDQILSEQQFYWNDVTTLRIYFTSSFAVSFGTLSSIFNSVFKDLSEMNQKTSVGIEPIFNLVPVLGAGRSATSMDDMLTCELFSMKT